MSHMDVRSLSIHAITPLASPLKRHSISDAESHKGSDGEHFTINISYYVLGTCIFYKKV